MTVFVSIRKFSGVPIIKTSENFKKLLKKNFFFKKISGFFFNQKTYNLNIFN
jgi:hypothetical protein